MADEFSVPDTGDVTEVPLPPEPDEYAFDLGGADLPPEPPEEVAPPRPPRRIGLPPSDTHPHDVLPGCKDAEDARPLDEYLAQPLAAPAVQVDATHKQVGAAVASLLDGRIRREGKAWLGWTGVAMEELPEEEVRSKVSSIIGRPDTESNGTRAVIPTKSVKVTKELADELAETGEAQWGRNGRLVDPRTGEPIKTIRKPADDWAESGDTVAKVTADLAGRASVQLSEDRDTNGRIINAAGTIIPLGPEIADGVCPRPLTRFDIVSRSLGTHFDPAAECPEWMMVTEQVFRENVAFVQQAIGVSLLGECREQKIFVLYGPDGNNGKSVFVELVADLLADYMTPIPEHIISETKYEGHATDLMPLRGARIAALSETKSGARWDINALKRLASPEKIIARSISRDNVTWRPTHTFWIGTNNRVTAPAGETAFWNRYCEIPCLSRWWVDTDLPSQRARSVGRADPGLADRLRAEMPGILNWALAGLAAYWRNGGQLDVPPAVVTASQEARKSSSVWAAFVAECLISDEHGEVSAKTLWSLWEDYRQDNSQHKQDRPTTRGQLIDMLPKEIDAARFIKAANGHEVDRFVGIRLTQEAQRPLQPVVVTPAKFGGVA